MNVAISDLGFQISVSKSQNLYYCNLEIILGSLTRK